METVGATRRFFACGYEGGAKRPISVNQGQALIRGRGCPRRKQIRFVGAWWADAVRRGYTMSLCRCRAGQGGWPISSTQSACALLRPVSRSKRPTILPTKGTTPKVIIGTMKPVTTRVRNAKDKDGAKYSTATRPNMTSGHTASQTMISRSVARQRREFKEASPSPRR